MTSDLRKGWCPGALRPMPTGDGLLVRLRLTGGILDLAVARAVADCARRFGNGQIDLTARANLQLRGVSEATLPALTARLDELGLIDGDAAAEAVRNVVASPLAGIDARLDIRPVVAALEQRLALDTALHALPAKFCFVVDDGGRLGLGDVDADVRFEALATAEAPRFAIRLGGSDAAVGTCAPEAVADAAAAIALTFLDLCAAYGIGSGRMRDVVARHGGWAVMPGLVPGTHADPSTPRIAGARSRAAWMAGTSPAMTPPDPRPLADVLGVHPTGQLDGACVGAATAFGRMSADDLDRIAAVAMRRNARDLRLTPWRAVLLTGVSAAAAQAAAADLAASGFILDPSDPRLAVSACVGAPACARATTPTQADAASLAPLMQRVAAGRPVLHVSGCAKGCGQSRAAPLTLVGRDGRYDLVRDGTARDAPVATGLTPGQARALIVSAFAGEAA